MSKNNKSRGQAAGYERAPWVSEIQDKGDLFYVEEYVHASEESVDLSENIELIRDKRNGGGNKFLELLPQMMKSKKSTQMMCLDSNKQKQDKNIEQSKKFDVNLRVNPPRIGPYKRNDLESVLGIIPLRERHEASLSKDSGIVIAGFIPNGPAISVHQLEIGDVIVALNGLELNMNNVNAMLGAIPRSMEVTLKIQKHVPVPRVSSIERCVIPNDNHLLKVINSNNISWRSVNLKEIPHAVMFLSLDISSEDEVEKDILFQFPKDVNEIVLLRGIFLTLGDFLTSVTGSSPRSTSVIINGQLVHIGYLKLKQEIFIVGLPSSCASLVHMQTLMQNLNQLLCFMFGSLHRAFYDGTNTFRLHHFFSLIFEYILGTKSIFHQSNKTFDPLDEFLNCTEAARWLELSSETKLHIDTCLNEIEANECGWDDELFTMRRQYLVLGSCLFYKGALIANHLMLKDLQDIVLYCRFHCLFTSSKQQRLAQLVIWREVFLTRQMKRNADSPLNFEPRTFLLIVGLKHFLIGIILEAGIVSQRANGNPGPDPYYIDLAKNILYEMENLDIPSVCETRLQNSSAPPTVTADHMLSRAKSGFIEKASDEVKVTAGSVENLRTGVEETESVHSETSGGKIAVLSPAYCRTRQGSNLSDASKLSNGSIDKMTTRINTSTSTLANLRKDREEIMDTKLNFLNKLSAGEENTILHYVMYNTFHGIIMSPFITSSKGKLHDEVLRNFNKACIQIRRHFRRHSTSSNTNKENTTRKFSCTSPDSIFEMGIQFIIKESKRKEPVLKYWVKGRLFMNDGGKEFYVCHQDTAAQNVVELAFKIGFGSPL